MSRICVKNLPKNVKEDELRNFFSQKGEVTDAKLMHTADGKSRQFGFVGYRTPQEAEEAIRYFNKSFMGACRITCEVARKVGDPDIPRPWSRYSKKKEEKLNEEKKELADNPGSKENDSRNNKNSQSKSTEEDDHELKEFLQVMQPRSKSKLWADDALVALPKDQDNRVVTGATQSKKKGERKLMSAEDSTIGGALKDGEFDDRRLERSGNQAHEEVISDADYFKSKVKKDWSESDSSDEENEDDCPSREKIPGDGVQETVSKEHLLTERNSLLEESVELAETVDLSTGEKDTDEAEHETARLFVRNLPYTASEEELEELFSRFGNVAEVHIVVDKETKCSKGFAYILYSTSESAARALQELDHSIFQGRLLHVLPAKTKGSSKSSERNIPGEQAKTFKQKRDEQRKLSETSGDTRAWNSLFMRSDTVVENIARKYGIGKSDLLDREASDLALRIAAGEAEVISDTKKALASAGVNVGALEEFAAGKTEAAKRSNHVLLVKNLPYNSTEVELSEMFSRYGSVDKIVLPPTRTLALVIYLQSSEARSAFNKLAYKRYKDTPLYLEWAPSNILSPSPLPENSANNLAVFGQNEAQKVMLQEQVLGISEAEIDSDRIESRSLFVKNLNFKTTEEILRKHITENMKDGKVLSVRIKRHLKNGKNVSMGFGFIEFDSVETATNVCKNLQGSVIDGHALILQLCHAKRDEKVIDKAEGDRSSTKLLVRNVAFEATEKELRQLFGLYGQIKRLTLPKKFGNHRGFAFVEYASKQEAVKAREALSSTHFYGRHLVLERAKDSESLEELRARTAAKFSIEQMTSKKRKRTSGDINIESNLD